MVTTAELAATVMARADRLGSISEDAGRLVRRPLTGPARDAEDLVASWLTEAGATVTRDAVGNVFGRLENAGNGGPALVIGSHVDTVRDAGRYDGPLGVLLGIAAMAYLAAREDEGDPGLPFALEVVAFAGEEGVRFAAPFLGSRFATGTLPDEWLARADDEGITLAGAICDAGGNPDAPPRARYRGADVVAYIEPHIEQGPVLDLAGEALGAVEAIVGQERLRLAFTGQANHAGTTPMPARRDALAGAAEAILVAERVARDVPGLVATVGEIAVAPGAANVIPGAATITMDIRHADDSVRVSAVGSILEAARQAAASRDLDLVVTPEMEVAATPCHGAVTAAIQAAARRTGMGPLRVMTSGAGHDAMVMSSVAPIGMLFVRSPGGISHHPSESALGGDVLAALRVLIATVDEVATKVRAGSFLARSEVVA